MGLVEIPAPIFLNKTQNQMNPNKTVSANSKGITISFGDVNKHQFIYYNNSNNAVKKIQIDGKAKYQQFERPEFNKIQKQLYTQALHGLKTFKHEEVMQMDPQKIKEIETVHLRAKHIINDFKQEVSNKKVDSFLSMLFPNSPVVKQMLCIKGTDPFIKVPTSLRDLKITPSMLAKKLVEYKVLPENFFNLV